MQKCWCSEPLERPSISEIDSEINSSYWNIDKIFVEAENKRQELLKSGKFIAKHIHPHSKTHSKLLNPTIGSLPSNLHRSFRFYMSGPVNFFQNSDGDSFNIILDLFKNSGNLNTASNPPNSKKHTIKSLSNEEDYNEIKRRKIFNDEISSSQPYTLPITEAIYKITSLSNLNLEHDKLCYEAGKILAEALYTNPTLNYLDLSSKYLCNGAGQGIAMALYNNSTLSNLNLEGNDLGDEADLSENKLGESAGKALAEALCKNNTLINLNLRSNQLGESVGKALVEALYKNTTLTNLNLRENNITYLRSNDRGESIEKALAEALCSKFRRTQLDLSEMCWVNQ
ncbi:NOD3 protein [Gigaspora margarita]|uniref:NOD3 protein n=1 Tax=Gigaspora margarita TaxID=4874 RepID=A0A8H3X7W6_GIGMA|nr:NOD3 protein [Gigaspora margarita]